MKSNKKHTNYSKFQKRTMIRINPKTWNDFKVNSIKSRKFIYELLEELITNYNKNYGTTE